MYVISATAKTREDRDGFRKNQSVPFIVYIDFKDLFGAEKLCQLYLLQAGFHDISIEKRKLIKPENVDASQDSAMLKAINEARQSGYAIQMFSAH